MLSNKRIEYNYESDDESWNKINLAESLKKKSWAQIEVVCLMQVLTF